MVRFKNFIILSVSIAAMLAPKRAAKACGFYVANGEFRFWMLQPDLTNQYDLTPFFFSSRYLYKGDMDLAKENYPAQNVEEWFTEIKGKAIKPDIDELLNRTNPQVFFDEQPRLAKQNTLVKLLRQPAQKELHRYMALSKKVEQIAANPDPWEEEDFHTENIQRVIQEARSLHDEAKTPFVQMRTGFQLMRLYSYTGQKEMQDRVYDAWIVPVKSNSWIKSAALYQKALRTHGFERDYLFSKVFDRGDYNRTPCLVNFSSKDLDRILPFAKNEHERNVLFAMKAFNYPGRSLDIIRHIYKNEPTYKDLQFLLLREINKIEDWMVTSKVTEFGYPAVYGSEYWDTYGYLDNAAYNYRKDKAYAEEVYQLILQMIRDNKNQPVGLLHLYAAHLCLVQQDYTCSRKHLDDAANAKGLDAKAKMQIRINRYLLQLENGFDPQAEKEFLAIVTKPDAETGFYDPDIMKNQLVLYTARKMLKQGNTTKGLMLLTRTNRALGETPVGYKRVYQQIEEHATLKEYDEMLAILDKKDKSDFEKFVTQKTFRDPLEHYEWTDEDEKSKWDRNKLLDCKASWLIRNHRLEESLATLKQIPDSFWLRSPYIDYIRGNAFYLNVNHSYSLTKDDKQNLNKKQIIEKMIYMEQLAARDKSKAAECYFQLANAWYNMSYYGKNWLMVKQWRSIGDMSSYNDEEPALKLTSFNNDYFGCRQAKLFYQKAIASTKDKKLAALCYFMVKLCEENYGEYMLATGKPYRESSDKIDYKELQRQGIDANYYRQLVEECELYLSFIKQYNRTL